MNILAKIAAPTRLFTLLFALLALGFSNCKKDKKPSITDQLVGEWEVKSYKLDGSEIKGLVVTSSTFEFEEAKDGDDGEFTWDISFADGTSDSVSGEYEVDEKKGEIEMTAKGETNTFEFELDGDDLELSATIEGMRHELAAERD